MSNRQEGGGIGFLGALTLIFIVLKLCGFINWSWWLILLPTWLSIVIIGFILFVLYLMALIQGGKIVWT